MTRAARQQARRTAQRQRRVAQQQALQQRSATNRKRRQRRNATAFGLKGATEFSCDPVLSNPVAVIEMFRRFAPAACLELMRATSPERLPGQAGAPRLDGSWGLVFLAHILTGNPDWQRWYNEAQNSPIWDACGFTERPSWATTYRRFCELEQPRYVAAFEQASHRFVRIAARNVPHGFDFVHIDGTPAHTHAKLTHACPNDTYCESRVGGATKFIARASDDLIAEARHKRSAAPAPDDAAATELSAAADVADPAEDPDVPLDESLIKLTDEQAQNLGLGDWRRSRYFKFGARGHIMRCRDKHVGGRMYNGASTKRKVWMGGYFLPAVSDFFWAPFALHFFEADIQEHLGWPALYRKAMTALNNDPDVPTHRITGVIADRAFTNKTFIGFNTNEGVASITPERKLPGGRHWKNLRDPDGLWDEHSPRCRYCGGPSAPAVGAGEGFALTGTGDPRIAYRCALGWTAECKNKMQTISCTREYRALLPIGRREAVFHDMLQSHSQFEGVFDAWRDRYAVSGTSNATRSKRRCSIPAQQLRGAAALLAEWFRICVRMGYIGNHARRNPHQPVQRTRGVPRRIKLREYRHREQLDLPMGPASLTLPFPAPVPANAPPAAAANAPPPAAPP